VDGVNQDAPLDDRYGLVTGLRASGDMAHDLWVRVQRIQAVYVIVSQRHQAQPGGGKEGHRKEVVLGSMTRMPIFPAGLRRLEFIF
jgi:hypothetical protein